MVKFKGLWELKSLSGVSWNPQNLACILPGLCFNNLWLISKGVVYKLCILIAVRQSQVPTKTRFLMFSEGFQIVRHERRKWHFNGGLCATKS